MRQILCSAGAFIGRVNGRDHKAFLRIADTLTAKAYEFMMYEPWYERADAIGADFCAAGMPFPVFHIEKRIGERIGLGGEENAREAEKRFFANCELAARLGSQKLVLHLWNGLPSDRAIERHYAAYARLSEIAARYELELTVENVVCAVADPLTHFEALAARYPEIRFTYDTKMAAFHRQETAIFLPRYRSLWERGGIAHIHLNDYGGVPGDFSRLAALHPGEGQLDFSAIAAGLSAVDYHGTVTLECGCMNPDGSTEPQKMNRSLAYAEALLNG